MSRYVAQLNNPVEIACGIGAGACRSQRVERTEREKEKRRVEPTRASLSFPLPELD